MRTLAITTTDEGTGKTAIAIALGLLARERDLEVGYMKPKGTRLQSTVGKVFDRDPLLADELLDLEADVADLEPVVYSSTFVQDAVRGLEDPEELAARVRAAFDDLSTDADLMLVEGADRLSTGHVVDLTDPDVADLLDAEVLLVADFDELEDLDDLLAAAEDVGDRLVGVLFNAVRDSDRDRLERDAVSFLENRTCDVVGVLPYARDLAGVTVDELADELGAERLTSGSGDGFVERFLVGAMSGDEALRHFRRTRNAAVVTGGDRAEIHTAAIRAPGVKCLVATGGYRPTETVLGKAEAAGLPVLAVNADTLGTVERADEIVRSGRTRDAETVMRMRELLEEHADVDGILGE